MVLRQGAGIDDDIMVHNAMGGHKIENLHTGMIEVNADSRLQESIMTRN